MNNEKKAQDSKLNQSENTSNSKSHKIISQYLNNEEIITLAQKGDEKAILLLLDDCKKIAYKILSDTGTILKRKEDREDFEQYVYVTLLEKIKEYKSEISSFSTFIYNQIRGCVTLYLREISGKKLHNPPFVSFSLSDIDKYFGYEEELKQTDKVWGSIFSFLSELYEINNVILKFIEEQRDLSEIKELYDKFLKKIKRAQLFKKDFYKSVKIDQIFDEIENCDNEKTIKRYLKDINKILKEIFIIIKDMRQTSISINKSLIAMHTMIYSIYLENIKTEEFSKRESEKALGKKIEGYSEIYYKEEA